MSSQLVDHVVIGVLAILTLAGVLAVALAPLAESGTPGSVPSWLMGLLGVIWGYYFGRNGSGIITTIVSAIRPTADKG